ncbi:anti-sigma factor [Sphingomonas sp. HITSZ_GF]|uniref:anti-sigma factor family protein n=1 Tax=Sphingomonas sp. HITSZ_GF TaxID=3037247 RepID=UPI00240D9F6A|nr:anti-sigma factor [Sphingomonas sp. HITSZ_GF]MDG2534239.1 anti-sigma factor [Sphingomonas sp. HITSZ_GF]
MSIDPEMLMAYADGELGPIEAKRVERAIADDPALGEQVAQHRALRAALRERFAPVAEEPVPDRLAAMLERKVVELPRPRRRTVLPGWAGWGGAVAASLALGVALGLGLGTGPGDQGYVRTQDGRLYASGPLASALDTRLAADAGSIRAPVSFRDAQGRYCRVFVSAAADGIACRGDKGWALDQTRPGSARDKADYAQAGSSDPALMAAAQDMMAGDPLDAAAEQTARAAGWR